MDASEIKKRFKFYVDEYVPAYHPHPRVVGASIGVLEKAVKGEANRRLVLKALCGHTSIKQMSDAELYALVKFVNPDKPVNHWVSAHGEKLEQMAGALLEEMFVENGQLALDIPQAEPEA
jgi:hypothetical protein